MHGYLRGDKCAVAENGGAESKNLRGCFLLRGRDAGEPCGSALDHEDVPSGNRRMSDRFWNVLEIDKNSAEINISKLISIKYLII